MIVLYDYVPFDRLDNIIKAICFIMTTIYFFSPSSLERGSKASEIIRNPTLLLGDNKPHIFMIQTLVLQQ